MFYMYNSFVAFKIPAFLQAEASFLRYSASASRKNSPSLQKNWVGVCGTLPETLTLFQSKICAFPYSIPDVIKHLIPYFRPEALEPGA